MHILNRGLASHPVGVEFSPWNKFTPTPGEGLLCQYHCRALWQCFRSQRWKTGEPSISCQNAPDCTKLCLKFQNFPGDDTPGPHPWGGDTPSPDPSPTGASFFWVHQGLQSLNPALLFRSTHTTSCLRCHQRTSCCLELCTLLSEEDSVTFCVSIFLGNVGT